MFSPLLPSNRHSKSGLTILESLVLLIAAILLALVAVPVLLVKYGYKKQDIIPVMAPQSSEAIEIKTAPIPPLQLPDAPKLPTPAGSNN
ncbi:MAG: hypothetical protein V4662_17225 [Verrucomicrobiota bacterium]